MAVVITNINANAYWVAGTSYFAAENARNIGQLVAAVATAAIGLTTAIQYSNKYREVLEWRNEIQNKLLVVSRCFNDHWCDVTYPQLLNAVQEGLNIDDLNLDCSVEFDFLKVALDDIAANSSSIANQVESLYCETNELCDSTKSRFKQLGLTNAVMSRLQAFRRRVDRRREMKTTVINQAHAGTLRNVAPAIQPLQTALNLSTTLVNQSSAMANSGFQAFGQGAGSVINSL